MILHHIPPSQSNAACEVQCVTMDTNAGTFQTHLLGCPRVFAAPKANNVQLSGGLMRYHSAPSSVLTGLLDDDFYPDSEDSEFARLLNDGVGSFSSLLDTVAFQQAEKSQAVFTMDVNKEDPYLNHGRMNPQHSHFIGTGQSFQEHLIQSPLSAISEHAVEEPVDKCCCPLPGGSAQQAAQPSHQNQTDSSSCNSVLTSDPHFNNSLPQSESGLIRHSSSPAGFLSKLALEEVSEGPMMKLGGSWGMQHCAVRSKPEEKFGGESIFPSIPPAVGSCFIEAKSTDKLNELSSPRRPNVLLRQSSSPAGLLSQVTLEEISMAREKMALSSSSGSSSVEGTFDKRRLVSTNCQAMGGWDDTTADLAMQHHAAFGQRKRGRGFDDKMLNDLVATNSLQRSPTDLSNSPLNNFTVPTNSPPQSFDSMEGSALDSVLCKARAKRGCATHPRSIAERVRRTKISERMKKLQDLVPNLDKQASTAEMLDEVVEYVQLLQRQVQELSLNRPLCNGICQQDRDSTL